MFFMIGVTLSIHPASIMVGSNTYIESQSKWTRWNGYIIFVLLLFVMDLFLTNAVYLAFYDIYGNLMNIGHLDVDFMDIFFSESFQVIVAITKENIHKINNEMAYVDKVAVYIVKG